MASDQKVAVVTGAAGGLGACFARKLAELDYELILIDRREDDVNRLCGELRSISNMKVEPIAADLCDNEAVAELARRLAALPHIELLINNAGFGFSQDFVDVEIQRHIDMIALHVMTPASLTHAVLPRMIERNRARLSTCRRSEHGRPVPVRCNTARRKHISCLFPSRSRTNSAAPSCEFKHSVLVSFTQGFMIETACRILISERFPNGCG